MNIKILFMYVEEMERLNVKPTFEGLKAYRRLLVCMNN